MEWKYATTTTHPPSPMVVDRPSPTSPPNVPPPDNFSFSLEVLDVYMLETSVTFLCSREGLPIKALIKSGYLGNTPTTPSLAISLQMLELFRHIQLHKSSFSVEVFTKVVCDLYSVSSYFPQHPSASIDLAHFKITYRQHYHSAFADTFEIYIMILRSVEKLVSQELGCNAPDW